MQNGSLHQKETVHDNDFEAYLTGQSTQVNPPFQGVFIFFNTTVLELYVYLIYLNVMFNVYLMFNVMYFTYVLSVIWIQKILICVSLDIVILGSL